MNRYFKEFILCGEIMHYCLVCQLAFYYISHIEKHIRLERHQQLVQQQTCVQEFIYEFYDCFYCILCNYAALDSTALSEHVCGEGHQAAIIDPSTVCKRPLGHYKEPHIIVLDYKFAPNCWHAILMNFCFVCAPNKRCERAHPVFRSHLIRIIQCTTRSHAGRHYRKLNDIMYQCYNCKSIRQTDDRIKAHLEEGKCESHDDIIIDEISITSSPPKENLAEERRIGDEEASASVDGAKTCKGKVKGKKDEDSIRRDEATTSGDEASADGDRANTSGDGAKTRKGKVKGKRDEASTSKDEASAGEDGASISGDGTSTRKDRASIGRGIVSTSKGESSAVYLRDEDGADSEKGSTSRVETSGTGANTSGDRAKTRKGKVKGKRDEDSIRRDEASTSRDEVSAGGDGASASGDGTSSRKDRASTDRDIVSTSKSETSPACVKDVASADRDEASTSRIEDSGIGVSTSRSKPKTRKGRAKADRDEASTSRDSVGTCKDKASAVYVKGEADADRDGVGTSRVETSAGESGARSSRGKAKTRKGRAKARKDEANIRRDEANTSRDSVSTSKSETSAVFVEDEASADRYGASTTRDSVSTSKSETSAVFVEDEASADRYGASTSRDSVSVSAGESSAIRDRASTRTDEASIGRDETSIARNEADTGRYVTFNYGRGPISMLEYEQSIESESFDEEAEGVICKGIVNYGKRRALLKQYAMKHYIKLNFNSSRGFCNLCNIYIMHANRNAFKLHAAGILHKINLEMKGILYPTKHALCLKNKFSINSDRVHTRYLFKDNYNQFWINNKYYIDFHSYLLIHEFHGDPHYRKIKCLVCEKTFAREKYREHCRSSEHENYFKAADVLSISEEFIREIKPNLYHCGFCNKTLPFWETVTAHLKKENHNYMKLMRLSPSRLELNRTSDFLLIYSKDIEEFYKQLMQILP